MNKPISVNSAKYRDAPLSLVVDVLARGEMARGGCLLWPGRTDEDGYGTVSYSLGGHWRILLVHRLVYFRLVADPGALPVDHVCHDPLICDALPRECAHRRCCNPEHLKAVTHAVNIGRGGGVSAVNAAKTHCDHDHEFTPENTQLRPGGGRRCRECVRIRMRTFRRTAAAADTGLVAQKAALAAAKAAAAGFLAQSPELTDNRVGVLAGCAPETVARVRAGMLLSGAIREPGFRRGADDKIYRLRASHH